MRYIGSAILLVAVIHGYNNGVRATVHRQLADGATADARRSVAMLMLIDPLVHHGRGSHMELLADVRAAETARQFRLFNLTGDDGRIDLATLPAAPAGLAPADAAAWCLTYNRMAGLLNEGDLTGAAPLLAELMGQPVEPMDAGTAAAIMEADTDYRQRMGPVIAALEQASRFLAAPRDDRDLVRGLALLADIDDRLILRLGPDQPLTRLHGLAGAVFKGLLGRVINAQGGDPARWAEVGTYYRVACRPVLDALSTPPHNKGAGSQSSITTRFRNAGSSRILFGSGTACRAPNSDFLIPIRNRSCFSEKGLALFRPTGDCTGNIRMSTV
ncbi:MAG: hypothetical protein ABIF71_06045 [Planctomycetota bacterium]